MKCDKCGTEMVKLGEQEVVEMMPLEDEHLSEGELADYLAAELSGDMGEWATPTGIIATTYECPECHNQVTIHSIKDYPGPDEG